MSTTLTGYKKRLARRRSGNPGPNQQWVPALVRNADGSTRPHPNAARAVTEFEMRAEQARQRRNGYHAEVEEWNAP
jgi:hypothetical protein